MPGAHDGRARLLGLLTWRAAFTDVDDALELALVSFPVDLGIIEFASPGVYRKLKNRDES
jgi:hypothetical protein